MFRAVKFLASSMLLGILVLISAGPARADDCGVLANCGFETGDLTGWLNTGNTDYTGVGSGYEYNGTNAFFTGPLYDLGYLSQTVPTAAGQLYDLTFWLTDDGQCSPIQENDCEFDVSWDGNLLLQILYPAGGAYSHYYFGDLAATSDSTVLQFAFRNDPGYFYLDDVSVTESEPISEPVPTPEPGTFLLCCAGITALMWLRSIRPARSGS